MSESTSKSKRRVIDKTKVSPEIAKHGLKQLLHEKLIRECRKDPNQFIQYAGSYNNKRWVGQAPLHIKWNDALSEYDRLLLICPREHGKTSQIVLRTIWELGKDCDLRIKLVCQGDDTATKRLIAIIEQIENNPRVAEVFPELRPSEKGVWTKTKIYVKRTIIGSTDPSIEASGILSTATGGRADILIFDDPVDFRNAIQQPSLREVVKEAYVNVWLNLLDDDGKVWYIATPWHKDDLTHQLLNQKLYHKITDNIDSKFTPIWPAKWPKERLKAKLEEIGGRAFDRAYRNKALSDEDALFPERLLSKCYDSDLSYGELPKTFDSKHVRYFSGVDIASGKKKTSAYSVIFTIAEYKGIKVPVHVTRGKYTSPQLAGLIIDELDRYRPELMFVESNNIQQAIIEWVQEIGYNEDLMLPIKGFFTGGQKHDESIGLPGLAVEFETGSWIIPDPNSHESICSCGLCAWLNEMKDYPVGKFSDSVMACWFAREAARNLAQRTLKITSLLGGNGKPGSIENLHQDEDDGFIEESDFTLF